MMKKIFSALFVAALITGCSTPKKMMANGESKTLDKEAHRGGRGLMPENTIPAMLHAIDLGVTTLEMDLQITKDKQVIVSHDPNLNADITTTPDGKMLTKEQAKELILYGMDYATIKKYDVGLKPYPAFPDQKKIEAHKPLLNDLLNATEAYAKKKGIQIHYNIEIKSNPQGDGITSPPVEIFTDLAMQVIASHHINDRLVIQSFDNRALQVMHKKYPATPTSLLIGPTDKRPLAAQLEDLGYTPEIYSPFYQMVTMELIKACHQHKMKVVPWTVNDLPEIKKLISLHVDGIITDYPNLFSQL